VDLEKLQELIRILEASELAELEIEEEGWRVRLTKPRPVVGVASNGPVEVHASPQPAAPVGSVAAPLPVKNTPAAATPEPEPESEGLSTIDAPMVGTFFNAPAPGEPPFVRTGDAVAEGQTLCIIEAMKLMNEVTAKSSVVVVECLVENGEPVEFGQALFRVRPLEMI